MPFGDFSNCIVGTSPGMRLLTERIRKAAANRDPLRITGPSGSYKRIVALEVHRLSAAPQAPFVGLNCGSVPGDLIEAELFGRFAEDSTESDHGQETAKTPSPGWKLAFLLVCGILLLTCGFLAGRLGIRP